MGSSCNPNIAISSNVKADDVKAEQFFCLTIYKTAAVPYEEDLKYQTEDL